jgi:hypothetical protein
MSVGFSQTTALYLTIYRPDLVQEITANYGSDILASTFKIVYGRFQFSVDKLINFIKQKNILKK